MTDCSGGADRGERGRLFVSSPAGDEDVASQRGHVELQPNLRGICMEREEGHPREQGEGAGLS